MLSVAKGRCPQLCILSHTFWKAEKVQNRRKGDTFPAPKPILEARYYYIILVAWTLHTQPLFISFLYFAVLLQMQTALEAHRSQFFVHPTLSLGFTCCFTLCLLRTVQFFQSRSLTCRPAPMPCPLHPPQGLAQVDKAVWNQATTFHYLSDSQTILWLTEG